MDAFHEVLFPIPLSFGATGGPERRNEIVTLRSGKERRNARSALSRRRYDAGTALRSIDDLYLVMSFFEARRGSLHGFRFRDPFDAKSCAPGDVPSAHDQPLGVGDGSRSIFHLAKAYGEGEDAVLRPVHKPRADGVKIAVAGTVLASGVDFTVDETSGTVTLLPHAVPGPGAMVTGGFEFDVPVRFDMDHLSLNLEAFRAGQIPAIPLLEILP